MPPSSTSQLLHQLRSVKRPLLVIGFATFISRSGGFLAIFGSIYLTAQQLSERNVVTILLAMGCLGLLGSLAAGRLSDRFSARRILVIASALNSVVLLLLANGAPTPWSMVFVIAAGMLPQVFLPPAVSLVGGLVPPSASHTPYFALFRLFLNLGTAASPLIALAIGEHNFGALFLYSAIANAAAALLLLLAMPRETRTQHQSNATAQNDTTRNGSHQAWLALLTFALLGCTAALYAQYQSTIPLQIRDVHDTIQLYSIMLVINSVLVIIAELPISFITSRFPVWIPLGAGITLMSLGLVVSGLGAASTTQLVIGVVLFTLGEMIFAPVSNTVAALLAPPGRQASYQGYLSAAQSLGFAAGPAAGVAIYFHLESLTWAVLGAFGVLCAISLAVLVSSRRLLSVPALSKR